LLSPRAILGAALACAVLAGCGDSKPATPDEPPAKLLERALSKPLTSGKVAIDVRADVKNSSYLSEPATVKLDGPFELRGAAVPRFDLDFDADVLGYGLAGRLISDGEDGYVVFFGENYRLGTDHIDTADATLQSAVDDGLRVNPADWLGASRYDGTEEVGGDDVHRITGPLRVEPFRKDLVEISYHLGLGIPYLVSERVRSGTVEFLVADDDDTLRGMRLELRLSGPGELDVGTELSDLGSQQEIERPEGGGFKPVEELLARFEDLAGFRIQF
jgi:hypothetical protein